MTRAAREVPAIRLSTREASRLVLHIGQDPAGGAQIELFWRSRHNAPFWQFFEKLLGAADKAVHRGSRTFVLRALTRQEAEAAFFFLILRYVSAVADEFPADETTTRAASSIRATIFLHALKGMGRPRMTLSDADALLKRVDAAPSSARVDIASGQAIKAARDRQREGALIRPVVRQLLEAGASFSGEELENAFMGILDRLEKVPDFLS